MGAIFGSRCDGGLAVCRQSRHCTRLLARATRSCGGCDVQKVHQVAQDMQKAPVRGHFAYRAETVGFEPTEESNPSPP
jgi:hypothetical protein